MKNEINTSPMVSDEIKYTTCYMCACRCGIKVHLQGGPLFRSGRSLNYVDLKGRTEDSRISEPYFLPDVQEVAAVMASLANVGVLWDPLAGNHYRAAHLPMTMWYKFRSAIVRGAAQDFSGALFR